MDTGEHQWPPKSFADNWHAARIREIIGLTCDQATRTRIPCVALRCHGVADNDAHKHLQCKELRGMIVVSSVPTANGMAADTRRTLDPGPRFFVVGGST
jgi:hypothetical protein